MNEELLGVVAGLIPTEEEDNQKLAFVGRLKSLFEKEWPGGVQIHKVNACPRLLAISSLYSLFP